MFGQVPPPLERVSGGGAAQRISRSIPGPALALRPERRDARELAARERVRSLVLAALVALGCTGATNAPPCALGPGRRVMLASEAVDPDVFLWDSRERLVDYTAGDWGDTRQIFAHTLLTEPGTYALVVACFPRAAHLRYTLGDADALGVRLTSGRERGRYGWVLSSDAHEERKALPDASTGRAHSN